MMTRSAQSAIRRRAVGLTLVELLLAITITAFVGTAVASMMVSVTYGTTSRTEMRDVLVRTKVLTSRMNAAVRGSKMVLDSGTDYVVLWIADTREDGQPNISELRRIERDDSTGTITSYLADFPDAWDEATLDANDTAYDLTENFDSITQSLQSGSYFPGTTWSDHVTAWTITLDDADEQLATLMSYRLTLSIGAVTETAIGAAALRNAGSD